MNCLFVNENHFKLKLYLLTSKFIGRFDTASNGKEALDMVIGNNYDIVFLELEIPILNGYETCSKIKNNYRNACRTTTDDFVDISSDIMKLR